MKKWIIAVVTVLCIAGGLITTAVVSNGLNKREPQSAGSALAAPLENADHGIEPFSYTLKEHYASFAEVVKEEDALTKYADEYYGYLLNCLVPIEAKDGFEAACEAKKRSGYSAYFDLQKTLREWESRFTPTDEEKQQAKEQLLKKYVNNLQTGSDGYTEHGKEALKIVEAFAAGKLTVDEALVQTGAIEHLQIRREKDREAYEDYLAELHMLSWFSPDSYLGADE